VPVLICLAGAGLALALLGEPGRFRTDGGDGAPPALTGWLTVAPPLAAASMLQRVLAGVGPATGQSAATFVATALAAVLVVVGFVAAMVQERLARRLAWAALGQAGLALLGFASGAAAPAAMPLALLLAVAPAQLGAMLLAEALDDGTWRPRWREAQLLLLAGLLLSLAGLPLLAGWRPRVELFAGLQAADLRLGLAVAAGGTLLALVAYLRPLVDLWRTPAAEGATEPPPAWSSVTRSLLAAALLAVVLARGFGMMDLAALLP
jgi:NADH-quinone oxidoreductase subunit N